MRLFTSIPSFPKTGPPVALVLLLLLALPTVTSPGNTLHATSLASASGKMIAIWGNPYDSMPYATAVGWESVTLRGEVSPAQNLTGYYKYSTERLRGAAHVEWTDGNRQFVLDATFSMQTDRAPSMPAITLPSADSFIITMLEFTATLTVDGRATQATGMAQMIASAPGLFTFPGQARGTMIALYDSPLGYQFVLRWSEANQSIYGIPQPAADRFSQQVKITGPS